MSGTHQEPCWGRDLLGLTLGSYTVPESVRIGMWTYRWPFHAHRKVSGPGLCVSESTLCVGKAILEARTCRKGRRSKEIKLQISPQVTLKGLMGVGNKSKTPFLIQLSLPIKTERQRRVQLSDRSFPRRIQGLGFKPQQHKTMKPKAMTEILTADPRVVFLIFDLAFSLLGQGSSLFWSIVLFCCFLRRKLSYFLALTTNGRQHLDGAPCRWALWSSTGLHCGTDNSSHDSDLILCVQDVSGDKSLGFEARILSSDPKRLYDHKQIPQSLYGSISWSVKGVKCSP